MRGRGRKMMLILVALCAAFWSGRVILEAVNRAYRASGVWFALDVLCAAIWIAALWVNWKHGRAQSGKEQDRDA